MFQRFPDKLSNRLTPAAREGGNTPTNKLPRTEFYLYVIRYY